MPPKSGHARAADLVVDASGRGALTLAPTRDRVIKSSNGFLVCAAAIDRPTTPEEITIGIDVGYATCVFCHTGGRTSTDWKGVTFGRAPQNSRGGLMLPARLPYYPAWRGDYQARGGSTFKNPAPARVPPGVKGESCVGWVPPDVVAVNLVILTIRQSLPVYP